MSKLSKKQLQERMTKLKAHARAEIAKSEVMHFRLDTESIEKLYKIAGQKKKPVGALIRQWVLEKLNETPGDPEDMAISLSNLNQRLQVVEKYLKLPASKVKHAAAS